MRRIFIIVAVALLNLFSISVFAIEPTDTLRAVYKLHGQTRKFQYVFVPAKDGSVTLHWGIERNLKWWKGSYRMSAEGIKNGNSLSYRMPEDGNHLSLKKDETFAMISRQALKELKTVGKFIYDGVEYRRISSEGTERWGPVINVADSEGAKLCILDNSELPLIISMTDNPLEINWNIE